MAGCVFALHDIHIIGKNLPRIKKALDIVVDYAKIRKPGFIIIDGDIWEKPNIGDLTGSTGDCQKLLIDFIHTISAVSKDTRFIVCPGNHDFTGVKKDALHFLEDRAKVQREPAVIEYDDVAIGMIPFINKGTYAAKHCQGKSKSETDVLFTAHIQSMLGALKDSFTRITTPKLLFGHVDIAGTKANTHYTVGGQGFVFTVPQIQHIGADYVTFGHIHKRGGAYGGALLQHDFRDEGNPQGFEILHYAQGEKVREEYISIDEQLGRFLTIEDYGDRASGRYEDTRAYDIVKLRYHNEESYKKDLLSGDLDHYGNIVEKLWNKRDYVARTESDIRPAMTFEDLLNEYVKINPLPAGINQEEVITFAKEFAHNG